MSEETIKNEKQSYTDPITGKFRKGNPGGGRPEGSRSFTTKVKEALQVIAEGRDYTYEEAFIKAILKKSIIDQDVGMMRTVWEQMDGKPLQRMANADGSNLQSYNWGNYGDNNIPSKTVDKEVSREQGKVESDSGTQEKR